MSSGFDELAKRCTVINHQSNEEEGSMMIFSTASMSSTSDAERVTSNLATFDKYLLFRSPAAAADRLAVDGVGSSSHLYYHLLLVHGRGRSHTSLMDRASADTFLDK